MYTVGYQLPFRVLAVVLRRPGLRLSAVGATAVRTLLSVFFAWWHTVVVRFFLSFHGRHGLRFSLRAFSLSYFSYLMLKFKLAVALVFSLLYKLPYTVLISKRVEWRL